MVQKSRIRVGAVSFLNTKPLIYPLLKKELPTENISLSMHVPSQLATMLEHNEIDIGLIPIVEYFRANDRGDNYRILPDISIASRGNVLSIQLFSHVPIHAIQKISLDTSSVSSVVLLKILLAEKYRLFPVFETCEPSVNPTTIETDAVLLIGDAALKNLGSTEYSYDLGNEWDKLTRLPFVYACWVARGGMSLGDVPKVLTEAKNIGVKQIPEIVQIEAEKLGLSEELCVRYLQDHIHYDLDETAIAGLERFYELAVKNKLIKSIGKLHFV